MSDFTGWHTPVYRVDASSDGDLPPVNKSVTTSRAQATKFATRKQRMGYDVYVRVGFIHWYDTRLEDDWWLCDGSCGRTARERPVNPGGQLRKRPPIPVSLRRMVYERDGYTCAKCGAVDDLSIDHIIPYSRGGTETHDNLRTLCRPCNSSRGNRDSGTPTPSISDASDDEATAEDADPKAAD